MLTIPILLAVPGSVLTVRMIVGAVARGIASGAAQGESFTPGILPAYCRHVVIQVGFNSQSDFSLMKAVFDS